MANLSQDVWGRQIWVFGKTEQAAHCGFQVCFYANESAMIYP